MVSLSVQGGFLKRGWFPDLADLLRRMTTLPLWIILVVHFSCRNFDHFIRRECSLVSQCFCSYLRVHISSSFVTTSLQSQMATNGRRLMPPGLKWHLFQQSAPIGSRQQVTGVKEVTEHGMLVGLWLNPDVYTRTLTDSEEHEGFLSRCRLRGLFHTPFEHFMHASCKSALASHNHPKSLDNLFWFCWPLCWMHLS